MFCCSASGVRSVHSSSIRGSSSILSSQGTERSSLSSRRVLLISAMRSVCSPSRRRKSAVSASAFGCSAEKSSSFACMRASGVLSSCAALPVNCFCARKPSSSRSSMRLKASRERRNSGNRSSGSFIFPRLFGSISSRREAKLCRGLSALPPTK